MTIHQALADGVFAVVSAMWLGLSVWFFSRYLRPAWGKRRKPQQLILSAASLGWVAFMALQRGWMSPLGRAVSAFEALGLVAGALVMLGMYLYEIEGGGRRR